MARRAKKETETEGEGVSAIRSNGFDPEAAKSFVDRLLNLHADLDKIAAERMAESKVVRGDMDEVYKEAKNAGIRKKALKNTVAKKLLEAKIESLREDLEGEDQDDFDSLQRALGDFGGLPLGQAALDKAKPPVEQREEATTEQGKTENAWPLRQ